MTAPIIEIVPAGESLATDRAGRKTTNVFTPHYDVICSQCGPVASGKMYPSACREKNDHLCKPRRRKETAA